MKRVAIAAGAFLLPLSANAETRGYEVGSFDKVSAAEGIRVDITQGAARSVTADTRAEDFDDLRIVVKAGELRIDRPPGNWFRPRRRADYTVRVVMPALRELDASSGSSVLVKGSFSGDFDVSSSSGSRVEIAQLKGGLVRARSSSGSALQVAGSCQAVDAEVSSGSNLDAGRLLCESATVEASTGSAAKVAAAQGLTASASTGASVKVNGAPKSVRIKNSTGGRVEVRRPEE